MAGNRDPSGRFAPGHTGNPDGRPRRRKPKNPDVSAFDVIDDRRITIVMGGLSRELTIEEALFHRTYQDALRGSRMAVRTVIKKINEREAERSPDAPKRVVILCEHPRPADVDEALTILGIATPCADRVREGRAKFLQLEPWAVTAALARRTTGPISQKELKGVQQHTRDSASVNWPDGGE